MDSTITRLKITSKNITDLSQAYDELLIGWNTKSLSAIKEYRAIGLDNENRVMCKLSLRKKDFRVNVLSLIDAVKKEKATKIIIGENALIGGIMPTQSKVQIAGKVNSYARKHGIRVIDQLILNSWSYYSLSYSGFN